MRPGERLAHGVADPGLPQSVRVIGALDFDDFGAQVAEQPAEFAAGDDDAEVDDPQPVKRASRRVRAGAAVDAGLRMPLRVHRRRRAERACENRRAGR